MPKTKVKRAKKNTDENEFDKKQLLAYFVKIKQKFLEEIKSALKINIDQFFEINTEMQSNINPQHLAMTIGELKKIDSKNSTFNITASSKTSFLNKIKKGTTLSRSSSFDEGYLTTESSTSVDRQSRSKTRQNLVTTKKKKTSRSLSRTSEKSRSRFVTPVGQRHAPGNIGTVTPKCNPSTPQSVMRHPKRGEMALSFQGSPLLVHGASDDKAIINVPLRDGTIVGLLPHDGLRLSQIPALDENIVKQLETLQHNLNLIINSAKTD